MLTSAIQAADPAYVARNQTKVRLRDYQQALQRWLTQQSSFQQIIFCDNSGYPLDSLRRLAARYPEKQIEFLSYHFTDYDTHGYGWGEVDIYQHVVRHSRLLPESEYIFCFAGRKYVPNIDTICKRMPTRYDIVVNLSNNLAWSEADFLSVRTSVFVEEFLPQMLSCTSYREDFYMFERAVAKATLALIVKDYAWYPLPVFPRFAGVSGNRNNPLSRRKENYALYTWLSSFISHLYFRLTRTAWRTQDAHIVDRLKIRRS